MLQQEAASQSNDAAPLTLLQAFKYDSTAASTHQSSQQTTVPMLQGIVRHAMV
jgi:hypothetical protein